jgi:hypothetical protein
LLLHSSSNPGNVWSMASHKWKNHSWGKTSSPKNAYLSTFTLKVRPVDGTFQKECVQRECVNQYVRRPGTDRGFWYLRYYTKLTSSYHRQPGLLCTSRDFAQI